MGDARGRGVVMAVAGAAPRAVDARIGQALGAMDGEVSLRRPAVVGGRAGAIASPCVREVAVAAVASVAAPPIGLGASPSSLGPAARPWPPPDGQLRAAMATGRGDGRRRCLGAPVVRISLDERRSRIPRSGSFGRRQACPRADIARRLQAPDPKGVMETARLRGDRPSGSLSRTFKRSPGPFDPLRGAAATRACHPAGVRDAAEPRARGVRPFRSGRAACSGP